jgi:hypothetical protein
VLTPRPAPSLRRPRATARRLATLAVLAVACAPAFAAAADGDLPYRATPVPDRVVLSPTSAPERSQTFGWRTDGETATGRAEAQRLEGGAPVGPVIAADATTADRRTVGHEGGSDYAVRHHRAKVAGLEPGTAYRYRVGSDAGWSPWRTFTTADPDPDRPWRWLAVGDAQNGLDAEWADNMRRARAAVPDAGLVVHAGDQVNRPTFDKDWGDWFAGLGETAATTNHLTVPGNHEYSYDLDSVDLGASNYLAHFPVEPNGAALGKGSTVVDLRGVRFITLDTGLTGLDLVALADQRAWLRRQLESNRQRWTVVTFHFPVYTAADRFPTSNPAVREAFGDLLEQHDVDLVLNGHDHTYARGHLTRHGPTYVVSVLGPKYYDQQPDDRNTWTENGATRVVAAAETSTFGAVCMQGERLVFESVIAAKGAASNTVRGVGEQLDAFTIDKRGERKQVLEGGRCATGDPKPAEPGPAEPGPAPVDAPVGDPAPSTPLGGPGGPPSGPGASGATPARLRGPALRWRGTTAVPRSGTLRLRLTLGTPGRLTVTAADSRRPGRRVTATVRRTVTGAGARTIVLRPTVAARRTLRRTGRLTARVTVSFRPEDGPARTVRRTVGLRLR